MEAFSRVHEGSSHACEGAQLCKWRHSVVRMEALGGAREGAWSVVHVEALGWYCT